MNKAEERVKTRTISNELRMIINAKLWASACLMKILYMSFAIALLATGLDTIKVTIFLIPTIALMKLDAHYLSEERLLRSRSDAGLINCALSWSVAPYYLSILLTLLFIERWCY